MFSIVEIPEPKSNIHIQTHGVMAHIKEKGATLNPAYFSYCDYLGDGILLIGYISFLATFGLFGLYQLYFSNADGSHN